MNNSGVILLLGMISNIHEGFASGEFLSYLVAADSVGFVIPFNRVNWMVLVKW